MSRRILVTGSDGFTGRYVCDALLKAGWEVWGAGLRSPIKGQRYLQINLQDRSSLTAIAARVRPEVVIHLAAAAFIDERDPEIFYQVNLLGTRNLLEALSEARIPPKCVILASSANVYGNSERSSLRESDAANPNNDYSVSKLAMEYLAKTFTEKLGIIIARPFNYTGIGQRECFLIPKLVYHFKNKVPEIALGNLEVARDFSDVRDIARYYADIASLQPIGETINLCSGLTTKLEDIVKMISTLAGFEITVRVSSDLKRSNEVKVLRGDRAKLDKLTGAYKPKHIRETLAWMLADEA